LKELRGTIGLLRSLPEVEPSPGLARSVIARIQAGEGQPTRWVRLLDGLDGLLRSRPLALVVAAGGVCALALLAPGWFAEQTKAPQAAALTTAADEASERALAGRLAPVNIWMAQAPFVRRPMGSSVPDEESVAPVPLGPDPLVVGPELGSREPGIEGVLRDPGRFLDELSQMPLPERDQQLSMLREEAVRTGREAEVVEKLRTTRDRRADAIVDGFERTSSTAPPP
jgi:hypothetical protein